MSPVLHRFDSVTSTQDRLQECALRGDPPGTAVLAAEQTAGRGRRGRPWVSPRGGLWLSVLCRPATDPAAEVLSLRVALVVARVVERHAPPVALELKWPNDLVLDGRKLGGILCEAHWQADSSPWVAVGLGLNLHNPIPPELVDRAVALADYAPEVTPELLAPDVVTAVAAAGRIDCNLSPAEVAEFRERDWLLGRAISAPARGVANGITLDGLLRIRSEDGRETLVRSGEVVVRGET